MSEKRSIEELRKIDDYDQDGTRGPDLMSARNHRLRTRRFLPQGRIKGLIFFLHGTGVHCHRPSDAKNGKYYTSKDFGYFTYDSDSQGLSEGVSQDVPSHDEQVTDGENYIKMVTQEFTGIPYIVTGESMGGAIALLIGHKLQQKALSEEKNPLLELFKGVAVIAPAIYNVLEPPGFVVSFLRHCIVPCCPLVHAPPCFKSVTVEQVFRTEDAKREAYNDPLIVLEPFRFQAGLNLINMTHAVKVIMHQIRFPMLILHGDKDSVILVSGSQKLYEKSATPKEHKTLKIFKDACHELYNDPVEDEVRESLIAFAEQYCR